jgi:hypothetical protein
MPSYDALLHRDLKRTRSSEVASLCLSARKACISPRAPRPAAARPTRGDDRGSAQDEAHGGA